MVFVRNLLPKIGNRSRRRSIGSPYAHEMNQNIIILKLDEEEVGIAVDEVIEVADIDLNMLQNTSIDSKEYIKGVIEFNKYLLTVIDINKIVNI